ncbi:MAG: restriction endonuclease subunit S, partial [Thiotrichaceae bacterium]|nr:restriction endonuclease subunit S [Thiotrichaceae bacterium]
ANALSDTDAWIQSLSHLIEKKRLIKQGAMQTLLNPYENGCLKEGWIIKKISSFTNASSGGTPSTLVLSFWNGDINWMSSGELNYKKIYKVSGRITEEGLNNSATKIIPKKCVLIGLAGQGKTRGTVAINYIELCTNQSIAAIYPCSTVSSEFLYFNLDGRYNELRNLSTGDSGRGALNLTIIKNIDVWMPENYEDQEKIAIILSNMDSEISELESKLTKAKQIKQGMMQQLLTGKIRLVTPQQVDP